MLTPEASNRALSWKVLTLLVKKGVEGYRGKGIAGYWDKSIFPLTPVTLYPFTP